MSLCFVFSRTKLLQTTGKEKEMGRYLHKSLPLGRGKLAWFCARLFAIFSAHRRTALFTMCFSSMCFVFTAKLGGRTAKAARLCTFPHGSAGLCTFLSFSVPSVPQKDRIAVAPSIPCLLPSIPFPGYLFHLSGYSITLSKQTGYILNFQSSIFQPMSGTS